MPTEDEETLTREEEPPALEAANRLPEAAIRSSEDATHFPRAAELFPYACNWIDIFVRERFHPRQPPTKHSLLLMGERIEFIKNRAVKTLSEAWYADATRVFPAGTPEGDMIRSTVPTTYNGPGNPPTPPAPPTP